MFRNFWKNAINEIKNCHNGKKIFLGFGVFDGVHLGHQKIFDELKKMSEQSDGINVAVTFSPHPREIFNPSCDIKYIVSLEDRINLLKNAGANEVIVVNFNHEFAEISAEDFLAIILEESSNLLGGICVGRNWRFGAKGLGNFRTLTDFCQLNGLEFNAVDELKCEGEVVSSSNVRVALSSGLFKKANKLLGRNYRMHGVVEKGYNLASTKLAKPTANLKIDKQIVMVDGVYGAWVYFNGNRYKSALNIGFAPTFNYDYKKRRIEVHILGFNGDIYGEHIEVEPIKYLREERTFSSLEELKKQINIDIEIITGL